MANPKPARWLNYKGDVRRGLPRSMGPNLMDEILYPVVAEYNPKTNMTRVGLAYILPKEPVELREVAA